MRDLTLKPYRPATAGTPSVQLVLRDGNPVGMIEKYRDTRTEHHPYKAYLGVGQSQEYLGAFYAARAGWPSNDGGRPVALAAIADRL